MSTTPPIASITDAADLAREARAVETRVEHGTLYTLTTGQLAALLGIQTEVVRRWAANDKTLTVRTDAGWKFAPSNMVEYFMLAHSITTRDQAFPSPKVAS